MGRLLFYLESHPSGPLAFRDNGSIQAIIHTFHGLIGDRYLVAIPVTIFQEHLAHGRYHLFGRFRVFDGNVQVYPLVSRSGLGSGRELGWR